MSRGTRDLLRRSGSGLGSYGEEPSGSGAGRYDADYDMATRSLQDEEIYRRLGLNPDPTVVTHDPEDDEIIRKMAALRALSETDKELILNLQMRINEQKRELEFRNDTITSIQKNFDELSGVLQEDRKEMEELREQHSNDLSLIQRLADKTESAETKIDELRQDLHAASVANEGFSKLKVDYQQLRHKERELNDELSKESKLKLELEEKLKDVRLSRLELEQTCDETRRDCDEKSLIISRLEAELEGERRGREDDIKRMQHDLAEADAKFNTAQGDWEAERRTLQARVDTLEIENGTYNETHTHLEKNLHSTSSQIEDMQVRISQLNKDLVAAEKRATDAESRARDVQVSRESAERALTELKRDHERLQDLHRDMELRCQRQTIEVGRAEEDNKQLRAQLEREAARGKSSVSELEAELDRLSAEVRRERDVTRTKETTIMEMERKMQADAEIMRKLEKERQTLEDEFGSAVVTMEKYRAELELSREEKKRAEDELYELRKQLTTTEITLAAVQEQVATLSKEKAHMGGEIDDAKRRLEDSSNLKEECDLLTKQLTDAHDAIAKLEKHKDTLQRQQETIMGQTELISQQRDDIDSLERAVAKLKQELAEKPKFDPDDVHSELALTIRKLVNATQAEEGVLTCMSCMSLLHNAVTLIPCGHTFCHSCSEKHHEKHCQDCSAAVEGSVENILADQMSGKFSYKKQALQSLMIMCGLQDAQK